MAHVRCFEGFTSCTTHTSCRKRAVTHAKHYSTAWWLIRRTAFGEWEVKNLAGYWVAKAADSRGVRYAQHHALAKRYGCTTFTFEGTTRDV